MEQLLYLFLVILGFMGLVMGAVAAVALYAFSQGRPIEGTICALAAITLGWAILAAVNTAQ